MEQNLQISLKERPEGQDYQVISFHGEFDATCLLDEHQL